MRLTPTQKGKLELDYKLNKQNNKEYNSTIDVTVNSDSIEIVTNNFKSFYELNNFKYSDMIL